MPEASSYLWCLWYRVTNQQRMAASRALEWIGASKARLVYRYKISSTPQWIYVHNLFYWTFQHGLLKIINSLFPGAPLVIQVRFPAIGPGYLQTQGTLQWATAVYGLIYSHSEPDATLVIQASSPCRPWFQVLRTQWNPVGVLHWLGL